MLVPVHSGSSGNHQTASVSRKSKQGTLVLFSGLLFYSSLYSSFCPFPCSTLYKDSDGQQLMAKQLDTLNKHLDKRDGAWFHEMAST